jgi:hypothetical protein
MRIVVECELPGRVGEGAGFGLGTVGGRNVDDLGRFRVGGGIIVCADVLRRCVGAGGKRIII